MKAVVLSSGGVDSTTCVAMAVNELGSANVVTLSFKYGQRHEKELESAQKIADFYGLAHYVYDLTSIFAYSDCSLLSSSKEKPEHMSYADQIARDGEGKVSTYVPFRNGLMLSAAAALAQSLYPEEECGIWIGAHADDAAGNAYADCSVAFNESMGRAISIGTYELVKLHAPLNRLNKAQVVAEGLQLGVPYDLTWSCYEGGEKACGKCATCIDRLAAFRANGCEDPIDYED
ncbi:7-cyano-7-deazaguanine synthase QueC [uncultured Parasutterella sp.]|uniref:7-cyano-7-deazaguanine synthase QueC n=1 Tax=uncultured Parasutterella sp. TaxID=1263098 RepID=UPI002598C86E|nr:7-cyano-7-deazaguanine synthase QueC [uncultured Parasutterella sp.]